MPVRLIGHSKIAYLFVGIPELLPKVERAIAPNYKVQIDAILFSVAML